MLLWGSIGLFTIYINLSPVFLAFLRAIIAIPILFLFIIINKTKINFSFRKYRNYFVSGILIGLAWTALFYGYKNTNISTAIIIYNMCPVYVMILAPFILKEKPTKLNLFVIFSSFLGLILIVGKSPNNSSNTIGIIFSTLSGIFYSVIVLINRKNSTSTNNTTNTLIQIISSAIILIPFVLIEGKYNKILTLNYNAILLVLVLGIIHTGIAYNLYFSTYEKLNSIEIVSFSYFEPLFGIILSVLFIKENISFSQIIGGVLILGSTYLGEFIKSRANNISSQIE
jgi:drug/metabolite transporter (DMT)-like permease